MHRVGAPAADTQARPQSLAVTAPNPRHDYVFTGPEGGLLNVNALRDRSWYPTLRKASLSRRTMYQTRHTFASNALAAGESPSWVSAMLGHASPEILFSVYARYVPNRTRRDGSALVQRMEGTETVTKATAEGAAVLPKYSR
jgi:integrase